MGMVLDVSAKRQFVKWAKERDSQELESALRRDPNLLCRALVRIFGPFPERGIKATPGTSLHPFRAVSAHLDYAIIRQLVGKGFIRATSKGAGIVGYEEQAYLLTRRGLNEVLNRSPDVMAEDVLARINIKQNLSMSYF